MNCLQHTIIQALIQPHVHLHLTAVSPKVPQYLILSVNVIYSSSHGILIHNICEHLECSSVLLRFTIVLASKLLVIKDTNSNKHIWTYNMLQIINA